MASSSSLVVLAAMVLVAPVVLASQFGVDNVVDPTPKRALKQLPAEACSCVSPNFACKVTSIRCPPGSIINSVNAAAQCETVSTQSVISSCMPQAQDVNAMPCPLHNEFKTVETCTDGLGLEGGTGAECKKCYNITFIGTCDRDESFNTVMGYARTNITVPKFYTCKRLGDVLDISDNTQFPATTSSRYFGPEDTTKAWFYSIWNGTFYNSVAAGDVKPQKITCNAYMMSGKWCQYQAAAWTPNKCKPNNYPYVVVGTGPTNNIPLLLTNDKACPRPV